MILLFTRIFLIVMDSLGVGGLPNSKDYGDVNVNTWKHISQHMDNPKWENLESLGAGRITELVGIKQIVNENSFVGKLGECSNGKDTMTGHWELMGLKTTKPFVTFTDTGFPKELIDLLEEKSGRKIVGNIAASGTEIIKEYGEHQMKTGDLIVYTSADSVLQIAAHEEIIPLEELYSICQMARELTMKEEWKVGRIIARPYLGNSREDFKRTSNRHDYAISPFDRTVLDNLKDDGLSVISVGKINDIFVGQGITSAIKSKSNDDGMIKTIELLNEDFTGLVFVNLVDFDAVYGHRRDPVGYGKCIEEFDVRLGEMINKLKEDDLLILTADHGTDPTYSGTDHTREYVPMIMYSKSLQGNSDLYVGSTFADIGATIADNFNVSGTAIGNSILDKIRKE